MSKRGVVRLASERVTSRTRRRRLIRQTGLAVEGPGFLVWDEVASDASKRAAELSAVARLQTRSPDATS
jgi:hypothetical protein